MHRRGRRRARAIALLALVTLSGAAPSPGQLPALRRTEEIRIGGESADFTTIHWLAVSRSGVIIAAQRMDGSLRIFDQAGRLLKVLGRPGGGPGEFGSIGLSGWTGDSLWVHDGSLARLTFVRLGTDATLGEPRATPSVPSLALPKDMAGTVLGTAPSALYPDGSALFRLTAPGPKDANGNVGRREAYWFVGAAGHVKQVALGKEGEICTVQYEGGFLFKPFCRETLLRESADGMHLAAVDQLNDSTVEVAMMRRDGGVVWKRRVAFTPMVMTSSAWDSIIATRVRPTTPPAAGNAWRALKAPSRFPPVRTVLVGRDGSLWLEGWGKNIRPWTALRPDGSTLGVVHLPGRAKLAVADVKQLWTIELDQDDLPSIVRYRVGK